MKAAVNSALSYGSMARLLRALFSLVMGVIPLWGVVTGSWSDATALALYWAETLVVGIPLTALRILLHRRWTNARGHDGPIFAPQMTAGQTRSPQLFRRNQFLSGFVLVSLGFSLVHGVFLAALLGLLLPKLLQTRAVVDTADLWQGLKTIILFASAAFAWDLLFLRRRPFQWIREEADGVLLRLMLLHLAIFLGLFAMAFAHQAQALLYTFFAMRLCAEAGALFPQFDPPESPRWLARLMDRWVPRETTDFATYWRSDYEDRARRRAEEETPRAAA